MEEGVDAHTRAVHCGAKKRHLGPGEGAAPA